MNNDRINALFLLRKVDCNDGIAAYCDYIVKELSKIDVSVFIVSGPISTENNTYSRFLSIKQTAADWHCIEDMRQIPSLKNLKEMVRIIRSNKIHVINVHGLGMLMWGKVLSIFTGVQVIATYHPSIPSDERNVKINEKSFSAIQRLYLYIFRPKKIIVLSEESKSYLSNQVKSIAKYVTKISGGVDTIYYRPPNPDERVMARGKLNSTEVDFICVLVGRLNWNKGHDLLVPAVRGLRKKHGDMHIKCLFVGTGDLEKDLKSAAYQSEEDDETFRFLGYVEDVRNILWASDILVLPSRVEGFALVVAEAMATGVVPIRTPSGGASDQIIEGVTGFCIPFENVAALSDAIVKTFSISKRKMMSQACIEFARGNFSSESSARKIKSLYMEK